MMECKVTVNPGACKMKTVIVAEMDEDMNVVFTADTECQHVKEMIDALPAISPYEELERSFLESEIYKAAARCIAHLACPVPCAMVKAAEAASGLGLKRDVDFVIE
jgi:hypothetical protein